MTEASRRAHRIFEPLRIGELPLRNRILRSAAFEGMCPGGLPSEQLVEHHRAVAAGGAAPTTVAYASVSEDGRTYGHQLSMPRDGVRAGLRRLTDAVHAEGAAASIQLGHSGYFADKTVIRGRPMGASRVPCLYGLAVPRAMTENDIARVTDDFVRAARLARESGFDAVEIHAGHGYLLSQFLSPYTNRRTDRWGGSLEGRARLSVQVVRRVREALPASVAVVVKTNVRDGFDGGLELDEAVEAASMLETAGADALVTSGGFVSKTPLYMLRGEVPVRSMARNERSPIRKLGLQAFGRVLVQRYPFREAFFFDEALRIRRATKLPLVLVGGVRSLDTMARAREAGLDAVALARPLIHDPGFVRRLERTETTRSACIPCNECIATMDAGGTRCVR